MLVTVVVATSEWQWKVEQVRYLKEGEAIDAVLENKAINPNQKPSMGCNIKWKSGNEPSY
ncbi:MAG: hypothetical protein A2860_00560 [Candidatus Levybacteria bacterium RIFCSPHIGHO2_01_FULL_37_33]|uniref:Uncharacterized protein n=1 Tax=Candidatus Blackburnbacteria bacterium RIFCSPLOWO2_01_FULL_41_27 TaxID=1797520 RepID=A0A1G1VD60_9BACT|nr:MAG: hypothetical protein A2860_00560 [Candidatus Levybacteria bacterium RIFCSPHIGHO2_01_FULL_37_33]OGH30005.1 MAG: hypothetical protein A3F30_00490 [Candidatus Levybacteria bacterium RIFCSPHIGHO2_12_FULL_37_12]OGY13325.1 MAG: hypothetical protein A3A58_03065 [Candidatus Blackburnbacteria bacterium RIFCSPLOWO2_01_FULL_41_27]